MKNVFSLKTRLLKARSFLIKRLAKVRNILPTRFQFILFQPPVKTVSTKEYCEAKSIPYRQVFNEEEFIRKLPDTPGSEHHWKFDVNPRHVYPKTWIANIPNACIVSKEAHILTDNCSLLIDGSLQLGLREPPNHKLFHRYAAVPKIRRFSGTGTVISGPSAQGYYHWFMDALPRLHLLLRLGYSLSDIDHFLIPEHHLPAIDESLDILGVPLAKREYLTYRSNFYVKSLLLPSMPGYSGNPPPWARTFLRDQFLDLATTVSKKFPTRFYIHRKQNRKVSNEEEILPVLEKHGVQPIQPEKLSFKQQIALFSKAELIVSPHGAALTNLIFCPDTTSVIELFSPNYVNPCYWTIANLGNIRYSYIFGKGDRPPDGIDPQKVREDIIVPVKQLNDWLGSWI